MTWQATRATDEDGWTEEYLDQVLSSYVRKPLPPATQKIGSVTVSWQEIIPGLYATQEEGGTFDDRRLACYIVSSQLDAYGLEQATFMAGGPELRKTAAWADIMDKARRLVESGQVDIGVHAADRTLGVVQGDHGTYEVEISRQDPASGVVTGWQCDCPWNQFAWQRTRQWKPLEGRMCAHALALQWASAGRQMDTEYDPAAGAQIDQHGQLGFDTPGMAPASQGTMNPSTAPAPVAPDQQLSIPGVAPGTATALPPAPPGNGVIPPFVPPGPTPVSIPGGKLPDPFNPMQMPGGTFSSVQYPMTVDEWLSKEAAAPEWNFHDGASELGHKFVYNTADGKGMLLNQDEKSTYHHEMEYATSGKFGGMDFHGGVVTPDGLIFVYYWPSKDSLDNIGKVTEDRYPPRLVQWIQEQIPNARVPQNKAELVEGLDWGAKIAAKDETFENSEMVRINVEETGVAEGKSEAHGSGQYRTITKNSIGEVLGQDPATGWIDTIFAIHDSGPMEPYHIRAWLDPKDVTKMPNVLRPGPFIKRR